MNIRCRYGSTARLSLLALGLVVGAVSPQIASIPALAAPTDPSFPDIQSYWGQPFIQALAERGIVTGYLDNTFRPDRLVQRDEFAAMLQKAFSQPPERQLKSGSVYKDIPEGYWAAPAIHDAYEMGFMKGYPGGEFRPAQPVTRVDVLVSLAQNLNLPSANAAGKPVAAAATATPQQTATRRPAKRPLMFPLAMTSLMQPLMAIPAKSAAVVAPPSRPEATDTGSAAERPVSFIVSDYYRDANKIPQYAIDDVADTTTAGIVVNYPDRKLLNPTQPATRGEVAALIHQALVQQGKINPLPNDQVAANYIVGR
jgi:hypothetical protein